MSRFRIFCHTPSEGPGYLADCLTRHGLSFELVHVGPDTALSKRLAGVAGLVFMGGPMSVNDALPWIGPELDLIRRATAAGIPVLGHCLGGQLISKALGGRVGPNAVKEIGWFPVRRVPGLIDTGGWLTALPAAFDAFHWHGESFSIPPGAELLLASEHCPHQAFAIGNTLALQFHPEMTAAMVRDWVVGGGADLVHPSASVQAAAQIEAGLEARLAAMRRVADLLYRRWLRPVLGT